MPIIKYLKGRFLIVKYRLFIELEFLLFFILFNKRKKEKCAFKMANASSGFNFIRKKKKAK